MPRYRVVAKTWPILFCFALVVASLVGLAQQPGEVVSDRPALPKIDLRQIEAWRKQFAYKSLADRLAYEKSARPAAPTAILPRVEERLRRLEHDEASQINIRAKSLQMLHSDKVDEFIAASGFGISRLPRPGAGLLPLAEAAPIPFERVSPLSAAHESDTSLPLPATPDATARNAWRLPAVTELADLHDSSQANFASPWSFGDVQSIDRVAGFGAHAFQYLPPAPIDVANKKAGHEGEGNSVPPPRWKIAHLELVSLLKHPKPAVYVSDHLPRMDELRAAKTRHLTQFETDSLAKLHEGEDVLTRSSGNRIEMFGSIRAAKQCLDCHQVSRGTLLGAFSYQLQRDPPMKAPPRPRSN